MTHAIGGIASIVGNYRVHIFTGGYSTLEVDEGGVLEYLIVAGGGAGGADHGGGGGGGQVITGSATYAVGTLDVYVGAGGLLGTGRGVFGTNGEQSYLGNIVAVGGGRGGQYDNVAGNTGSSGGGGASFSGGASGGLPLVSGTTGQAGAAGNNSGAGGGGGAATVGQQSEGGNGIISDLTGVSLMYGSGGGGADRADGVGGSGAGSGNQVSGTMSGLPNRGGGGGGNTSQLSGSFGGSGIVAVRYLFTETGRRQIQTTDIDLQCLPLAQYTDTKSAIEALTGTTFGALAYASDNPTAPLGVYTLGGWHWYSTGSVGGASLAFQDEGVPLGTPGTVNFVGSPVSVTVSGTVARVFITGSSGGVSDHNSLTGLQGGTGSQYYHLGYNEWGGLVTGSLTYLHKHSAVDIVTGTVATPRLGSGTANAGTFLSGDQTYKPAHSMIAKNTSGATANAGDVGYIDSAGEYKTTTTANFNTSWVVVIVGAANGSDIYVTNRGRIDVNYTGTAPSAGHYLVTSTVAGLAGRSTVMRPEIFAVCLAAGSGGVVSVLLLTQSIKVDLYSSNNFWRNNAHSTTLFTGTINGAPTATSVVYTVSTGNEDIFAVLGTGELAKLMLYNSTRGTYRLITACNTGTNTLTTVSSADAWANGDTLTVIYQTINDTTAGQTYVGLNLSQQSEVPILARSVILQGGVADTGGAGRTMLFHPNEALATSKILTVGITQSTQQFAYHVSMPLIDRILGMKTVATGAGTALTVIKLAGYYLASP